MKIKTSEATPLQLDWLVAKIEGKSVTFYGKGLWYGIESEHDYRWEWQPSTNWAQGGPIIEREKMKMVPIFGFTYWYVEKLNDERLPYAEGPTPLIAAMRCYVASKMGDEVEIPDELK